MKLDSKRGITLVALIITIIVLLILSAVTLTMTIGKSGILGKALTAKEKTQIAGILERLNLWKTELIIENGKQGKNEVKVEEYDKYIIEKEIKKENIIESDDKLNSQVEVDGYVFSVTQITPKTIIIEYLDKAENLPYIKSIQTKETTNSIVIENIETYRADGGYYKISYKKVGENKYKSEEKIKVNEFKQYEMKELETGIYEIKIEVYNSKNKSVTYKYCRQTKDFELLAGMITPQKVEWNNSTGYAKVTLVTQEDFLIEYQVKEEIDLQGQWVRAGKIAQIENVESGDIIWARLTDGTNATSNYYETLEIKDTINPTVVLQEVSIRSNSITVNAIAEDKESGIASDSIYHFYIKGPNDEEYQEAQSTNSNTLIRSNLIQKQKYKIKVEIQDRVGNKAETEKEIETQELISKGNITFGQVSWNTSTQTASVKLNTNTSYKIQYQIGSTAGTWKEASEATGVQHGQTIYARLVDGTNVAKDYATATIKDTTPPEPFTISGISSISSTGFVINAVSPVDRQTSIASISYYIDSDTTEYGAGKLSSNVVTGLSERTTKYVWAVATDKAGNTRKSTNYYKVVTPHTHIASCYGTSISYYNFKRDGDTDKTTVTKSYCSINASKPTSTAEVKWAYGVNNEGMQNGHAVWHYGAGHIATCRDYWNYSSTNYLVYDYVCKDCGRYFDSIRNGYSYSADSWKCRHETQYLNCSYSTTGTASSGNF